MTSVSLYVSHFVFAAILNNHVVIFNKQEPLKVSCFLTISYKLYLSARNQTPFHKRNSRMNCFDIIYVWNLRSCYRFVHILCFSDLCRYAHIEICRFQDRCRSPLDCRFYHFNLSNATFLVGKSYLKIIQFNAQDFPSLPSTKSRRE